MFLAEGHNTPDYEHIGEEPLTELANSCRDANVWLDERQQFHDRTGKQQEPPYLASEISAKIVTSFLFARQDSKKRCVFNHLRAK